MTKTSARFTSSHNSRKPSIHTYLVTALIFFLAIHLSHAGSATWSFSPISNDWNTPANWTPAIVPTDTATFDVSSITELETTADAQVGTIVFNPGASSYTIIQGRDFAFTIAGAGIVNNSGLAQHFVSTHKPTFGALQFVGRANAGTNTFFDVLASEGGGDYGGEVDFYDSSAAGEATFTNRGDGPYGGYTQFFDRSSAAGATLINNGTEPGDSLGGETAFYDESTTGNAMIINQGGISPGFGGGGSTWYAHSSASDATVISEGGIGPDTLGGLSRFAGGSPGNATLIALAGTDGGNGGVIEFANAVSDSTARLELFGNASLVFDFGPVEVGSIEGDGNIALTQNLTVGTNNLSTTFSGLITEGKSLKKVGGGSLTLTGANTYAGGTTIDSGILVVNNQTGSATGTGSVQVNGGRLGGRGTIAGKVTLGSGSGSGAALVPRRHGGRPDTLTIQSQLTFNSDSSYRCGLDTERVLSARVVANGVVIIGAQFSLLDDSTIPLPAGTVLRVIDNTSADPISGTFANLPDGGTITLANNTFQASYEGGDGNDLTLTVLP